MDLLKILLLISCFYNTLIAQNEGALKVQELDKMYQINFDKGDYGAAEFNLLEGIEIRKKELGIEHPITLEAQWSLAAFYQKTEQIDDAAQVYARIIPSYKKVIGEESQQYVGVLVNAAAVNNELGDYGTALELYLKAKDASLKGQGKEHLSYAYALEGLATTCYNLNRYEEASSYYKEVLALEAKLYGQDHQKYAFTLSNLASVYQATNQLAEAVQHVKQALFIQGKTLGKNDDEYANSLNTLAVLYIKQERYSHAEKTILEVLSILEKKLGKKHPWYLSAEINLVALWLRQGNYEKAEKLCLELNETQIALLGKKHPSYINGLGITAKLYLNMGHLDQALDYIMQSINACLSDGQPKVTFSDEFIAQIPTLKYDYELKINYLYDLLITTMHDYYEQKKDEKWLKQRHEVIKNVIALNETFRNAFSFEQDKYTILKEVATFINQGMESSYELDEKGIAGKHKEDAFMFAEQNKSMLLLDALKSKQKRRFGNLPDTLVQKEMSLQKEQAVLQKRLLESSKSSERSQIRSELNDLKNKISQFKAALKKEYPRYFNNKYSKESISKSTLEIQALLDEKTLLLEYFVADSTTYLFAISQKEIKMISLDLGRFEIKEAVEKFRKALSQYDFIIKNKEEAWQLNVEMGHWFYQKILEPGLKNTSGIKKLIIIPDSELGHLPFEAFLTKSPQELASTDFAQTKAYNQLPYVLNDYQISYNYSAILWKENINNPIQAPNHNMLACAAEYGSVAAETIEKRGDFLGRVRASLKPLPAAQKEVKALSGLFAGEFLTGEETNEGYFKANSSNFGIIHLAMHGILSEEAPILSSLAFSENNDDKEDNFLQAYEISQLKLNAELVVLSACETGLGKFEQGEGVLSLARSFMYAGVPSLVVSLWQVHDLSTALLMQAFYKNLQAGMNKAEALRQAKIHYIKIAKGITAHPAFWSPFIQLGDSLPLKMSSKTNWLWWGGVALLLFVGGFFVKKKKQG